MAHDTPGNPWPRIGWGALAATLVISCILGFAVLSRYQQNGPVLDTWSAICRGLGLTADKGPAKEPQPPLHVSSYVAWTEATLGQIRAGNPQHGADLAMSCTACHNANGISNAGLMPTLAGMDAAVIYKQLDDFRNGLRPWRDMTLMASLLSPQDSADVAAYWASRPGLPKYGAERAPAAGRSLRQTDPAIRLVYAGAPERGIPPCAACHGPGGHKLGAPTLAGQQQAYIEHQLVAFATGQRQNDINEQMRTVARQLTPEERRALAAYYGTEAASSPVQQSQAAP
ncbi:MAG TPA: c-type cytochrome [Acetobacteraceae bacterium]|nr:c-type cytochrome [Acetobacteraceae bacterium]